MYRPRRKHEAVVPSEHSIDIAAKKYRQNDKRTVECYTYAVFLGVAQAGTALPRVRANEVEMSFYRSAVKTYHTDCDSACIRAATSSMKSQDTNVISSETPYSKCAAMRRSTPSTIRYIARASTWRCTSFSMSATQEVK